MTVLNRHVTFGDFYALNAYEMNNKLCSCKRPFKVKKDI